MPDPPTDIRMFEATLSGGAAGGDPLLERIVQVARIRWLLLIAFGCYGLCAAVVYAYSPYGFFLSPLQLGVLGFSVVAVCSYNAACYFRPRRVLGCRCSAQKLTLLDLAFVTLLIHFSGGSASWFWPVYLIVTIEAAFLLDQPRQVWIFGICGGAFYGLLLAAEFFDLVPHVTMPFVNADLRHDPWQMGLLWLWVSLLNATVAVLATRLMAAQRRETMAARRAEERLLDFLQAASDLIFCFDRDGRILFVNRAWSDSLGFRLEELGERTVIDLIHGADRGKCLVALRQALSGAVPDQIEGYMLAADGHLVAVAGHITCSPGEDAATIVWGVFRDVSAQRLAQEQLYHMAHHDTLTGLPNRLFFMDRLRQARALAKRHGHQLAVLFLDLDRFKLINDTLGHPVGDRLLQEMAIRLSACVRESDSVARLGGDEFTVLLADLHQAEDAETVAGKIIKALAQPLRADGHELFITTSIGISLYPGDGDSPDDLVKKADIAMYHAKAQGRNNYQHYDPAMDLDADRRLHMENGLRKAIEQNELRLAYQPKVDSISGRITCIEALLRWQHPELGLLPPGEFVSLAEETGLIGMIGEWVLRQACRQNRQWQEQGLPPVRVAVNLSAHQLQQKGLVPSVRAILDETGLEPHWLELEITETVIMQNPNFAERLLAELRELGVYLSIDDFGTGYSSLAHLKRFTVNTLKIDKSFVRDVETSSTDAAITSAIIAMGNSLNLTVIAEGVETEGQRAFLRKHRCAEMQGFLFSRPVPAEEIAQLLRNGAHLDGGAPVPAKASETP